jgi:hypothetical protein
MSIESASLSGRRGEYKDRNTDGTVCSLADISPSESRAFHSSTNSQRLDGENSPGKQSGIQATM